MEFTRVNVSSVKRFNMDRDIEDGDSDERSCDNRMCQIDGCTNSSDTDTSVERHYGIFVCPQHWRDWREHMYNHKWLAEHGLAVVGSGEDVKRWLNT